MKLKFDAEGHVVVQDGKPVYVHEDGKEVAFDYASTLATIGRLNGEAKSHRERAEAAESRAKLFEGIEDAEAARKALATVKNLDDKKLVDAGEVDRIKAEVTRALEEKHRPIAKRAQELETLLSREVIGGNFARSKFIADKLAVPLPMVEATFGQHFTLSADGKIVAKDTAGNQIYSLARPGELATFDEAIETLINASPFRDSILKGSGASGSGAQGNQGGSGAGPKSLGRSAFEALSPAQQMAHVKSGGTIAE
jgi:hypothetical protein